MTQLARCLSIVLVCTGLPFACDSGDGNGGIDPACNPLGAGVNCLMPWPSSAYLAPDSATGSGFRLAIPPEAMPVNVDSIPVDPTPWNRYDGFGPSGVILAAFPTGVSASGLPTPGSIDLSMAADSPIVLLNMDTGKRVAFFAEVDMNTDHEDQRALIIHPMERLQPGARHVVAIRKAVRGPGGSELPISPAFEALVNDSGFSHPLFDKLAPGYPAIFAALQDQGVARDDLVLAWDFVTSSDAGMQSDLTTMRDLALPAIGTGASGLQFQLEQDTIHADPSLVHRLYHGTYDAPNFMSDGESDRSIILRGDDGHPVMDGMYEANVSIVIPACVATAELPVPAVLFGHGLFGTAEDYLTDDFAQEAANDFCTVLIAGDWIGLTIRQVTSAALSANDLNRSHALVEKLEQAVINFIALEQLMTGKFADAPELQYEGTQIIDTNRVHYLGASLGGIMGGTFMAYDPVITRGALGVPGGAWSLLMERSFAWAPLQVAALSAYEDQYDYQLLIAFLALSLERSDPISVANNVIHAPLPNTPAKQLLLWEAMNDSLVTNLSTELMAREYGIPVCGPSLVVPWGMEERLVPELSALTIYDENPTPRAPVTNVPPLDDNGTHGGVNDHAAVLRQVKHFLLEGQVINPCRIGDSAVPCDCTIGACD